MVGKKANANLGYIQLWERRVSLCSGLFCKPASSSGRPLSWGTDIHRWCPQQGRDNGEGRGDAAGGQEKVLSKVGSGHKSTWRLDVPRQEEPPSNSWRIPPQKLNDTLGHPTYRTKQGTRKALSPKTPWGPKRIWKRLQKGWVLALLRQNFHVTRLLKNGDWSLVVRELLDMSIPTHFKSNPSPQMAHFQILCSTSFH